MELNDALHAQVGVLKAIALANKHGLAFLPVHHMEAHALVARQAANVPFPFLCLLVSGGHNLLLVAHGVGDYTLLGNTLDDAVGQPPPPPLPPYALSPSFDPTKVLASHPTRQ